MAVGLSAVLLCVSALLMEARSFGKKKTTRQATPSPAAIAGRPPRCARAAGSSGEANRYDGRTGFPPVYRTRTKLRYELDRFAAW